MKNVDLTHRILELVGKPTSLIKPVADRPGHDRRYSLDTVEAQVARLAAAARVRAGSRRDRRRGIAQNEWLVAADQGPGPGVPEVLPGPVRQSHLSVPVAGLPLITGATGFAGGHLLDRLARARYDGRTPWAHQGSADAERDRATRRVHLDRGRPARSRARCATALAAARPSVIYHCAGIADVHDAWRAPARALRVNVLGTHHLLEARARRSACRAACSSPAPRWSTARAPTRITEDDPIGPAEPVRRQQARAGDDRAASAAVPAWLVAAVQSCRPAAVAGLRDVGVRAADRRDRGRAGASRSCASATSTRGATSPTCATPSAPTKRWPSAASRAGPTTSAAAGPTACASLLDILLSLARVKVRVEVDPARLRPSDNPVILGSHARLTADTGWTPVIPIEQTLADLLDYWRRASWPHELSFGGATHSETARQIVHMSMGGVRAPAPVAAVVAGGRAGGGGAGLQPLSAAAHRARTSIGPAIASAACTASSGIRSPCSCCSSSSRAVPTSSRRRGASSRSATAWPRWPAARSADRGGRGTARRR